jgi:hypothetical protein
MKNINIDLLLRKFFDVKIFISSIILTAVLIFTFNYNTTKDNRIVIKIYFNFNKQKLLELENKYFGSKLVLEDVRIRREMALNLKEKLYLLSLDFEKNLKLDTENYKENKIQINKSGSLDSPVIEMILYNNFKGNNNIQYKDTDLQDIKKKINLLLKTNFQDYDFFIFLEKKNFKSENYKYISTFVFLLVVINFFLVAIKFRKNFFN